MTKESKESNEPSHDETNGVRDPSFPVLYSKGIIIPIGRRPTTGKEMLDQLKSVLSTDYSGPDAKKCGMTKGEAISAVLAERAECGDLDAISMILDRTLGKPVQQVNALSVSATIGEFLDTLKDKEPDKHEDNPWD